MTTDDWKSVSTIYLEGIQSGVATFETTLPSFDKWDANHTKECRFVYEKDSEVVGYTIFSPVSSRDAYRGVVELSIYIKEGFKGMGIGTALLKNAIDEAKNHGFWTIFSVCFSCNKASINLHKKCGFRIIGYREKIAKDIHGNWQNTTILEYRNSIE